MHEFIDGEYQGQSAAKFFKDRYEARSRFVHSGEDYDYNDMITDNNALQQLVADLIQAIARGQKVSTAMDSAKN
ncbi:hypothetical protein [Leifsonia sp. fls2-241-R2A-40a]|uniref:hypothetical protein n=1 Tax=Leifsonia sp. fls2-241-R2A-40a TaxID=3040290 RepID=UPI002550AB53|nr:hypothetical protein [Leifsonia sp. fls2-241-R2A-40a]